MTNIVCMTHFILLTLNSTVLRPRSRFSKIHFFLT